MMNLLILSCGTRNKIVQAFKKELDGEGKVYATDTSLLAPALYEADHYFIVPPINDPNYLETVLAICRDHRINLVLSLIDPELSLLAEHQDEFLQAGTIPMISNFQAVEICFDKYRFYRHLIEAKIPTVKTYQADKNFYAGLLQEQIDFPLFVKPVKGSASQHISKVHNRRELDLVMMMDEQMIIQEYMAGKELGADLYIDMLTGDIAAIFIKEKLKMRAGETDKAVSCKDPKLFRLLTKLAKNLKLRGVVDVDIFQVDGEYYISEVNPRFGGGYPHAYGCGVNFPRMILNNLKGIPNKPEIGNYASDVYMMKYNEVIVAPKSVLETQAEPAQPHEQVSGTPNPIRVSF